MAARDPHRFINDLDRVQVDRLVARLESRAQDQVFVDLFEKYLSHLPLASISRVLEIGCGTGAMLRRLARRKDFNGTAVGLDQSPVFIEAASKYAGVEGVGNRIEFQVGDAHNLEYPSASFDLVIVHTVLSHVTEPLRILNEAARMISANGIVVFFDGDYASLTYAYPDREFGRKMDDALANATFNNPWVMRELPQLLPQAGLRLLSAWGDDVAEIGTASYFSSFAETYLQYVVSAGLLPSSQVDTWLATQRRAMENGTFFASCNYYTFLTSLV